MTWHRLEPRIQSIISFANHNLNGKPLSRHDKYSRQRRCNEKRHGYQQQPPFHVTFSGEPPPFCNYRHGTIVQQSAQAAHFLCVSLRPLRLRSPSLLNSDTPRSGSNLAAPKAARQDAARRGKPQISAPYSDGRPWCQAPHCARGGGGYGLVFDRIFRINRIEGDGKRNAEGAEITRRSRRGNSNWWQGYANAPPQLRFPVLSMEPLYIIWQLWSSMAAINDNCSYHRSCSHLIKLPISGGIIFSKEILTFENPYKRISERSSLTNSFSTLSAT